MACDRLVLVLGDQLSLGLASLRDLDRERDRVLMAEVETEATYVRHHKKKLALVFSAMRHFAADLAGRGVALDYRRLDEAEPAGSLYEAVAVACAAHDPQEVVLVEPGEWRLRQEMEGWEKRLGRPVRLLEDDRFLCSRADFAAWAEGRKSLRMEHFYREMRRRSGFLMAADGEPEGGKWNFDHDNRKALPADAEIPRPYQARVDAVTEEVLELVEQRFSDHFGSLRPFHYAVTAEQAERALESFVEKRLASFGDYQDAMRQDEPFLFHATIAAYLNLGLLDPHALCARAERAYHEGGAPLNAVEGFIRQVLGWREYVRGLYWLEMPAYAERNALEARRPLPRFWWTGETDMACLAQAVGQTRDEAYAHHIQRLMVLGNFALLAGLAPAAVNYWYLVVYADAYEWVQLPNTHGMVLWADGGRLASKPYAASGKYIDRMSDHCRHCRYDPKQSAGDTACPFNALYWDFIARHRERFRGNPRMAMPLRSLERMAPERVERMRRRAGAFLDSLDYAEEGEW